MPRAKKEPSEKKPRVKRSKKLPEEKTCCECGCEHEVKDEEVLTPEKVDALKMGIYLEVNGRVGSVVIPKGLETQILKLISVATPNGKIEVVDMGSNYSLEPIRKEKDN